MAFLVKPTAAAKQDARDILSWLRSQEAGEAGLRWFQGMQKAIASLSKMPTRCGLAPENKNIPFEVRQLL
jgi:plasmid stabilization system protein ParE